MKILMSVLLATSAHAHWWCRDYQTRVSEVQSRAIVRVLGSCRATALQVGSVDGGAGWTGGYSRQALVETIYSVAHYARCSGEYLGSEPVVVRTREVVRIDIANPNLVNPAAPSYIRQDAPLTDSEARAARPAALRECQALRAGSPVSSGIALLPRD